MEKHEVEYIRLKESGYNGWGGKSHSKRIEGWLEQLDKLLEKVNLEGNQVLEIGCGAGDVSLMMASRGYEVTGIDISPTAIDWAKEKAVEKNLKTTFIVKSVSDELFLEEDSFDLIIDGNCLHCLFDEDRTRFYDHLKKLIKTKGYVFISSAVMEKAGDETPVISSIKRCFVDDREIQTNLEKRGFKLIEAWYSHGTHKHYYGIYQMKSCKGDLL